jgi:hypothetical protein
MALQALFTKLSPTKRKARRTEVQADLAEALDEAMDDNDDGHSVTFSRKDKEFLLEMANVISNNNRTELKEALAPITTDLNTLKNENAELRGRLECPPVVD